MKTKVEIAGYEIEIEEKDGLILVKAEKDDEVIEEFTIETEGFDGDSQSQSQGQAQDEVQGFEDFESGADEEEDFGEDFEDDFEDEGESKLESFQSFVNKKK